MKETLSSNTLFHFTNSGEKLISILKHEFKPRYCLEDMGTFVKDSLYAEELAFPMVCFCDIPLSKIKHHLSFYGNFGIGLSKEWGVKNKISPLTYVNNESALLKFINNNILACEGKVFNGHPEIDEIWINTLNMIRYFKPYEGKFWRNGKYLDGVRFYDEREWRYIPDMPFKNDNYRFWINKNDYLDEIGRSQLNEVVSDNFRLRFEPNDIKYIIVEKEQQIPSIIRAIEQIKNKYDEETIKLLTTRIISKQQIEEDY